MNAFGTHNARFCSGYIDADAAAAPDALTAVVPLGPVVVAWDVHRRARRNLVPGQSSMIVHLARVRIGADALALVCTHHGAVSLWCETAPTWQRVSAECVLPFDIETAQARGRRFAVFGEAIVPVGGSTPGRVALLAVEGDVDSGYVLRVVETREGAFAGGYFVPDNDDGTALALFEQRDDGVWLHAPPLALDALLAPDEPADRGPVYFAAGQLDVFVVNETGTLGVLGCRNRRVVALDLATHRIVWTARVDGHGIYKTLRLHGRWLLCPADSGRLFLYDIASVLPVPPSVQLEREAALAGEPAPPCLELQGPSGVIHAILSAESATPPRLDVLVCNDYSVTHVRVPLPPAPGQCEAHSEIKFHELTCCGVDLRASDSTVAAGDFTGQVLLWQPGQHDPAQRFATDEPIRCLRFLPSGRRLLLGTVAGQVLCVPLEGAGGAVEWARPAETVTCIDLCRDEQGGGWLVAAATTSGHVTLLPFRDDEAPLAGAARSWLAHAPVAGPQDLRFGSIGKFAEVWSLVFAPDSGARLLATGSEDQTVRVWRLDADGQTEAAVLRGHTAAVTCVSWSAELLISASDDRTVRVYQAATWTLRAVLTTEGHGLQWHTLTYCALAVDAAGTRTTIVAGSSNGYLAVWHAADERGAWRLASVRKVHAGSIEGLAAHPQSPVVASCSSDCSVHLTALSEP